MAANAVVVFYGIKILFDLGEIEAADTQNHPLFETAKRFGLHAHFGRESESAPYFLLVGTLIDRLGVERNFRKSVDRFELENIMRETEAKLQKAGIHWNRPAELHLQFEIDY
jgi:hypothetical protein